MARTNCTAKLFSALDLECAPTRSLASVVRKEGVVKIGELAKTALGLVASIGGGVLQFMASFIIAGIVMAFGQAGSRGSGAIFERIIGNARAKGRPDAERQDATDWLRSRLADGPRPAKEIQEEAEAHGIRGITLRRAFRELRGEAFKVGSVALGQCKWMWKLPGANCPISQ